MTKKSDAYLKTLGAGDLSEEERAKYIQLCYEEGSLSSLGELAERILVRTKNETKNEK